MKRSADVAHLDWLEPESDEGNVEYKLRLKDPSTMRFQQLVTQMKFRLSEGNGECFYYLGEHAGGPSASNPCKLGTMESPFNCHNGHLGLHIALLLRC